jgi:hypothetical protein
MTTTTRSAALMLAAPVFSNTERLALAGFLAGYSGLTRAAYELDLRQYASWCHQNHLRLFQARRADIEYFARDLEARGRARATIMRRLCTARCQAIWTGLLTATTRSSRIHETVMSERWRRAPGTATPYDHGLGWGLARW